MKKRKPEFGLFVSLRSAYLACFLLVGFKILVWLLLQFPSFNVYASGNDANLYHSYVIGHINHAPNIWPKILRVLYDAGLYERYVIAFILFLMTVTLLPFMVVRIVKKASPEIAIKRSHLLLANLTLFVIFYPSTFLFSLDLYRDIFMLLTTVYALFLVERFLHKKTFDRYIFLVLFFLCSYLAYHLRAYLGASLILAFFTFVILRRFRPSGLRLLLGSIFGLVVAHQLGWLDLIILYRGEDGFITGSTSFGIGLVGKSTVQFLGLVVLSASYQVFGLYAVSPLLILLFLLESVPIIFGVRHILKNSRYLTSFGYFLLSFILFYTFIWVIGNDNMGTALRLRMPTYIALIILFGVVEMNRVASSAASKKAEGSA